jgi:hypothetical protein
MTTKLTALFAGGALVVVSVASTAALQLTGGTAAPKSQDPTLGGGSASTNAQGNNGNGNGSSTNPGHPITLSGSVTGTVAPGSPATLTVTIGNPNNQDIVVTSLTGTITSVTSLGLVGRPGCSPSWYSVGTFSGSKAIAKNKSATISVPLSLSDLPSTNQDNCKGSTVQFSFTAQAQQA